MVNLIHKVYRYWRLHGTAALWRIIIHKLFHNQNSFPSLAPTQVSESQRVPSQVAHMLNSRFQAITPLRCYTLPIQQNARINIVTDSIAKNSLFGGVGTSLIFAALLANKKQAQLRIITRTERSRPENVEQILSLYGIKLEREIQFKFAAPSDHKYEIDIGEKDTFITTSWWTTAATLPSVPHQQIVYLLQEDERMFYPYGDDRLRCESILHNQDIRFLINTELLFNHLVDDGFENIRENGEWFEPAFPIEIFHPREKTPQEKLKFFFYARPNNLRNLFYLGIETIEMAISSQILDLDKWEIYLVGKDIPSLTFGNGYVPKVCENLAWSEYAELLGLMDMGLSLMYTPHPSYPPLDLAASGAVAVTNRFASKRELHQYSSNIICADAHCHALLEAIRIAADLAINKDSRRENYNKNGLNTNWERAFEKIINRFCDSE